MKILDTEEKEEIAIRLISILLILGLILGLAFWQKRKRKSQNIAWEKKIAEIRNQARTEERMKLLEEKVVEY